ncbi:MAG TPA: hypothetical protein VMZ26_18100, partial [Pyrinomonadaceae bacterium]|nr:hypothetical protein [Pyrinomonadaceae bacterium]
LTALKVSKDLRANVSLDGRTERQAIYYENKKLALFSYRSAGGIQNDRILMLDFNQPNARVSWSTKEQPNCLFLRKDTLRIKRPFYGAEDGFVYEMDRQDRDVAGVAYRGEFQTPHMDLGFADPGLAGRKKLFDRLAVTFEETGNWNLSVDVFIDGNFVETIAFPLTKGEYLNNLFLNTDEVIGPRNQTVEKPLHGSGRRISFRCYNSGLRQNFKISALTVGFRVAGDDQGAQTNT